MIQVDPAKTHMHIPVMKHLVHIQVQGPEGLQHVQLAGQLLLFLLQKLFVFLDIQIVVVHVPDQRQDLFRSQRVVRVILSGRQKAGELFRLGQRLLVRVHLHKGKEVLGRPKFCDRVLKLHLIFGKIDVAHPVDIRSRTADA